MRSILIVEDEVALRELLTEFLATKGFDVQQAANGEEALAKLATQAFDVVITDVDMPKKSGIELLTEIRRSLSRQPFVILMSGGMSITETEARRLGANEFLLKPFSGMGTLLKLLPA